MIVHFTMNGQLALDMKTLEAANGTAISEVTSATTGAGNRKHGMNKIKIPDFVKRGMKSPKAKTETVDSAPPNVSISFDECLKQRRFSEAGRQLIAREDHLFGRGAVRDAGNGVGGKGEKEEDELQGEYETLLVQVWLAVEASFTSEPGERDALRSAARCVLQEEEQDRRWREDPDAQPPVWRPRQCRLKHNELLRKVVEERMTNAEEPNGADKLSSAVKKDICKMGKKVREDLLKVAREVKACYPEEFDVCNVYARLYHQAFSDRLAKMAKLELDVSDCNYLLSWVNSYYANDVLKHTELEKYIDAESLGSLLPEELVRPLEEQYVSHKEGQVKEWASNALKEENDWFRGCLPEIIMDQYYFSSIAIDVIQAFDGAVKEAKTILGDISKSQRILCQLEVFLMSYKRSLEEFMKGKRENTKAVIKANLASIEQFKEYVVKIGEVLPEETQKSCQSILLTIEDAAYRYLSSIIHDNLKMQYRLLGTSVWLTGGSRELEEQLDKHIHECGDLKTTCKQELVGRIHTQVMVEYVKRLMKGKLKLKDREQQEAAASVLCEDSNRLHTVFTDAGSKENWLYDILPKIAEVLKLQDPGAIQLEVITLARDYPDLSKDHITALLHLKSNLSNTHIKRIKQSLTENRDSISTQEARSFFSSVQVKWTNKIM